MRTTLDLVDLARWQEEVSNFLSTHILSEAAWPDLATYITNWNERECVAHAQPLSLPIWACVSAEGVMQTAIPLSAYWRLNLFAARILDDLQDGDSKDAPWHKQGVRQTLPLASGVLAAANLCLTYLSVPATVYQDVQRRLHTTWLFASRAQSRPPTSRQLDAYFETIIGASGLAFAAIAWCGGRLATDHEGILGSLSALGYNLGLRDAIYSDCRDLREDIGRGLSTLPVIYATSVTEHPLQPHLTSLLDGPALVPNRVDEVCRLLDEMQALVWCDRLAQRFHAQAVMALQQLPSSAATRWWQQHAMGR